VQHDEGASAANSDHRRPLCELERRSAGAHPYELPEIIAVPIERGLTTYLDWVAAETK